MGVRAEWGFEQSCLTINPAFNHWVTLLLVRLTPSAIPWMTDPWRTALKPGPTATMCACPPPSSTFKSRLARGPCQSIQILLSKI
jgi:hypothetical protein